MLIRCRATGMRSFDVEEELEDLLVEETAYVQQTEKANQMLGPRAYVSLVLPL